jgi:molybdate transport system regulatory protein
LKAQVKNYKVQVRSKVWLEVQGRPVLGPGRREILRAVDEQGSISQAARRLKITFRKAWAQIKAMEEQLGFSVLEKQTGGKGGGGARLTAEARDLLSKYDRLAHGFEEEVNEKFRAIFL